MKKLIKPTESELSILQILWQYGPLSVRTVNEMLAAQQHEEIGYTTTLKIMQIMTDKGLVKRNTNQRSHIYEPVVKENETQQNLLSEFLDATYRLCLYPGDAGPRATQKQQRRAAADQRVYSQS